MTIISMVGSFISIWIQIRPISNVMLFILLIIMIYLFNVYDIYGLTHHSTSDNHDTSKLTIMMLMTKMFPILNV